MPQDVADEDQWRRVLAVTVEAIRRLDILVKEAHVLAGRGAIDFEHVSPGAGAG